VLSNNTLQNIQLINLAHGNNNKLGYKSDTDKPVKLSVPDPPERNLSDAGFLNLKAYKINLGAERCSCAAQTVSAFASTANSTRGNREQCHGVGEIGKVLQGEPKVGIKGKECHRVVSIYLDLIPQSKSSTRNIKSFMLNSCMYVVVITVRSFRRLGKNEYWEASQFVGTLLSHGRQYTYSKHWRNDTFSGHYASSQFN
jgi:hypothetical protein